MLVLLVHFSLCIIHLDKWLHHKHCLDYTYSYFFKTRSFKKVDKVFSEYFIQNKQETYCSFKISEKYWAQALTMTPTNQMKITTIKNMSKSKEEAHLRNDLTDVIAVSNETFARSLNQISLSMSTVAQNLTRSFEFMNQKGFNNSHRWHTYIRLSYRYVSVIAFLHTSSRTY